ncbi:hypothetical protein FB558_0625 [Pseudonocardia kunmingensis]|uniref:DUF2474 domain-containing protein n=1 Tax=Pseudonocardia kunmingensis TaxID=630975 RepID=A0A543DX29_9PSEU|nr:hypothetical protein FB558_0625 [Pseudonocardia kunmingensis]
MRAWSGRAVSPWLFFVVLWLGIVLSGVALYLLGLWG